MPATRGKKRRRQHSGVNTLKSVHYTLLLRNVFTNISVKEIPWLCPFRAKWKCVCNDNFLTWLPHRSVTALKYIYKTFSIQLNLLLKIHIKGLYSDWSACNNSFLSTLQICPVYFYKRLAIIYTQEVMTLKYAVNSTTEKYSKIWNLWNIFIYSEEGLSLLSS